MNRFKYQPALVRNAIEAIGEEPGGEVRVHVACEGSAAVTIAVVDNGPGLPEAAKAKLFQPFFTTKAFGTGLGLSITRTLVRALGGELSMEPALPRGTRAILRLPQIAFQTDVEHIMPASANCR